MAYALNRHFLICLLHKCVLRYTFPERCIQSRHNAIYASFKSEGARIALCRATWNVNTKYKNSHIIFKLSSFESLYGTHQEDGAHETGSRFSQESCGIFVKQKYERSKYNAEEEVQRARICSLRAAKNSKALSISYSKAFLQQVG